MKLDGGRMVSFDFKKEPGLWLTNSSYKTNEKPIISVITPYFNGGKYIEQTAKSVLNQTFPFFEWIIVDDGSKKDDASLLDELQKTDCRIRVYHKKNEGVSVARNYAVEKSETEYILPLDCDDLIEPTFIEYCWWMLEKNPKASWAYCDSVGFQDMEYVWTTSFNPELLKKQNHLTNCAIIRKSDFLAVDGYTTEHLHCHEDWHLWLKLVANHKFPVQSQGEPLMWYRRTDAGRFTNVENESARVNDKIIDSVANTIKDPIWPTLYPKPFEYHWTNPNLSKWNISRYEKKEKTNVLFLFPHLVMGGADKFNFDLILGLTKKNYEVGIITTLNDDNTWLQKFRDCTPDIFNLTHFVNPEDYAEFITYYINSRQVDVLFVSNSYHGYYLIPWLRENYPDLAIVDYVHMEEWYWRNGGYARTSAAVGSIVDKTYVCNKATEKVLVDLFGRTDESVQTVHIGVDHNMFSRSVTPKGVAYSEINIDENRPIVLFACRLHPQKRPMLMIEIAKRVSKIIPEVAFLVVGDGPMERTMRQKVKQSGLSQNVFFVGAKDDVRPYYMDAKATLICSIKEGLALTAYESCSMGVPVISADVGGQSDLVDNEVGALIECRQDEAAIEKEIYEESEIQDYVDSLVEVLTNEDDWKKKSVKCRERVEQAFSVENMVETFDDELKKMLSDENTIAKRRKMSKLLAECTPMAAELYLMEMQEQCAEDTVVANSVALLQQKVKSSVKELGYKQFIKKAYRKFKSVLR